MNKEEIIKYAIISLLIRYDRMESNLKKKIHSGKPRESIISLTLILVFAIISSGCVQDDPDYSRTIEFSVIASASGPAELFVPLPEYSPMVKGLKVSDGKGDFEVVDTPYGRCMKITFDSFININAKVHPSEPDEIDAMTANLTTMEPEIVDNEYRYFWCNVTSNSVDSFRIRIDMEENIIYTNYYYNSINSENMTIGWHLYQSEYSHGKRFAP